MHPWLDFVCCLIRMSQMGPNAERRGGPGIFMFLSPGATPQVQPTSRYGSIGGQGFASSTFQGGGGYKPEQSYYDFDTVEVGVPHLLDNLSVGCLGRTYSWLLLWQSFFVRPFLCWHYAAPPSEQGVNVMTRCMTKIMGGAVFSLITASGTILCNGLPL